MDGMAGPTTVTVESTGETRGSTGAATRPLATVEHADVQRLWTMVRAADFFAMRAGEPPPGTPTPTDTPTTTLTVDGAFLENTVTCTACPAGFLDIAHTVLTLTNADTLLRQPVAAAPPPAPPDASTAPATDAAVDAGDARADACTFASAVVSLQRGACFGKCPVYTVRVASDGRVDLSGVKVKAAPKISPGAARGLACDMIRHGFFGLSSRYQMCATDHPTYVTTLVVDGRTHSVERNAANTMCPPAMRAPGWLPAMEDRIDAVAGTRKYVR
jgi:hypothetical protein